MRNIVNFAPRIFGNKYFPIVFILIAFIYLTLFSWSTSPLYANEGMDSAVFKTMGQALLKGKVIYRDIFDHKGPYLYFVNALGQWIYPGRMGLFFLQVIGLSLALWYMFRTAKLFVNPWLSIMSLMLTLFIYIGHIQEGNQCEEWMMYAICFSFYYVSCYFVRYNNEDHPLIFSLIYGICFGFTFYIRPNDAIAWIGGFMSGVILWLLCQKRIKNTILNIFCFFSGFFIISLPVLFYFISHNALNDLWFGLFDFNIEYSGGMKNLILSCFEIGKIIMFILFILFFILALETQYLKILFYMVPSFLMAVLLMGASMFPHYYITFIPFWVIFFTFLFLKSKTSNYGIFGVVLLFLLFGRNYLGEIGTYHPKNVKWNMEGQKEFYNHATHMISLIPDNEKDSIWNFGLRWRGYQSDFSIFNHFNIVPCNKITYGKNEYLENIDLVSIHSPKWILYKTQDKNSWINMENFIADSVYINNHYELIGEMDENISEIKLYKRRD